jgi:cell division protein FtsQ
MSQTIRRNGASARKTASRAQNARKVEVARAKTGSAFDSVLGLLPFSERQWHRIFLVLILACAGGLLWIVASFAGVPALAEERVASLTSQAGFVVRRVEVHGVKHINELQVYERVLGAQNRQAMTRIDLAAIRADLLQLNWVEDARVSRQLPDTLVVEITERSPHAVMRVKGADGSDSFVLIDATGHELQGISASRAKGRMVLAGAGAEAKVADLATLLDAAPALRPQVAEAEWVGHRRWNLTFKSGQTLALPEGPDMAGKSLVKFAQYDGTNQLIGGSALAFDMRSPDKLYMRVAGRREDGAPVTVPVDAAKADVAKAMVRSEKPTVKPAGNVGEHKAATPATKSAEKSDQAKPSKGKAASTKATAKSAIKSTTKPTAKTAAKSGAKPAAKPAVTPKAKATPKPKTKARD